MARNRKNPTTVEEAGIRVRLYKRGRQWYYDVRLDGDRRRGPLETTDKATAEDTARELAKVLATQRLTGVKPETLTLGQLFAAYRQHRLPTLAPTRQREAEGRMTMFAECWGADLPVADIDQTRVTTYCAARRDLRIVAPGLRLGPDGKPRKGYRKPQPVRDGALDSELRFLNVVLNWACDFRVNGGSLLVANPLPRNRAGRRSLGWPVERNPRRPVAAHDRYERTQEHTDAVDPAGRLRCMLALARYTARRESAICQLWASDLLLSPDRVRAALADAGLNEADAGKMPHGAIRWREEADKMGRLFVSPMGPKVREEVDRYLHRAARVGDVPLFPAPGRPRRKGAPPPKHPRPEQPIGRDTAAKWLVRAERLAGLPKLRGGVFHPYRRLWAIERQHLPAIEVAALGGWSDPGTMTGIYQRATAAGMLAVVMEGG
jgi:integrase